MNFVKFTFDEGKYKYSELKNIFYCFYRLLLNITPTPPTEGR